MPPPGPTAYLISCVSQKREQACAARDLYVSDLFRKARRYAEASGCPWFILSAEHGLVAPTQVIAPYERTLNTMRLADRRAWAERVAAQLAEAVPDVSQVVFLAGLRYREFLTQHLVGHGVLVSVPMEGLRIGEQLSWLGQNSPRPLRRDRTRDEAGMIDVLTQLEWHLDAAVQHFWEHRRVGATWQSRNLNNESSDAATGGTLLDGFRELVAQVLISAGLDSATTHWREQTDRHGYSRPDVNRDLVIVADGRLVAMIEFRMLVGSIQTDFNSQTKEAVGNAVELWAAYEEGAFALCDRPWLGCLMLLEDAPGSTTPVKAREPHFKVFPELRDVSYAERYNQFLTRMVRKRLYDAGCFLMSTHDEGTRGIYREPNPELGFRNFVTSLLARAAMVAMSQPPGPPDPPRVEAGPADAPKPG